MRIQFSNQYAYYDDKKRQDHISFIQEIYRYFDFRLLNSKNIMIYFGWKSAYKLGGLGQTYIYDVEPHREGITEEFAEVFDQQEIYDFYVYFATDIYDQPDPIYKTFTIAHEFQHIAQYLVKSCHFLMGSLLYHFLWLNKDDKFPMQRIPYEYDARRTAKSINYEIYGRAKVDQFLEDRIRSEHGAGRSEYQFLQGINIEQQYDLFEDNINIWDKFCLRINEQVMRIKQQLSKNKYENDLLMAYEYLLKKCPEIMGAPK